MEINSNKQAGAELCQAQAQLEEASLVSARLVCFLIFHYCFGRGG